MKAETYRHAHHKQQSMQSLDPQVATICVYENRPWTLAILACKRSPPGSGCPALWMTASQSPVLIGFVPLL